MMGGRATAMGFITRRHWNLRHSVLDLMLKSASTSPSPSAFRILASWSAGPANGLVTRRTFTGLVVSSPLRFPFSPFGFNSQHFFKKTIGSWRMLSSTDDDTPTKDEEMTDKATKDERKTLPLSSTDDEKPSKDEETKDEDTGDDEAAKDERTTKSVLDYFNKIKFFEHELYRNTFENGFSILGEDKKEMLMKMTHEFYQQAWKKGGTDEPTLKDIFTDNIHGCKRLAVLQDFHEWKRIHGVGPDDTSDTNDHPRIVDMDFQIAETKLSHSYDLECFSERVDNLFECHANATKRKKYIAPYFCFVQSSGMGKTKILWEYQRTSYKRKSQVTSFVIVPTDPTTDDKPIFPVLNIRLGKIGQDLKNNYENMTPADYKDELPKVASRVFDALDVMLSELLQTTTGRKVRRVALLFDESQNLLKEEFGYKAFRFRCIRLWLREIPTEYNLRGQLKLQVVAVFTGTSSKLTEFLFESDQELISEDVPPSRNFIKEPEKYYEKGKTAHLPFLQTMTIGSCRDHLKDPWKMSEYERAVHYGRPLFALMAKEGILHDKAPAILYRMLHRKQTLTLENQRGLISVLSSRAQLGQVSLEVASDLVASTYANLAGYNDGSRVVQVGYSPDPVPARLAMCMMDEHFSMNVEIKKDNFALLEGKDKKWWSDALCTIFSNEMVRPDKGDSGEISGEIFAAFYMLFCGDRLRKLFNIENNRNYPGNLEYSQFSVSLDAWLNLLLSGGKFPEGKSPDELCEDCKVSIGFIQVCRNPLRSYTESWEDLSKSSFLQYIYESGIGFFTCNNCPLIDMVVPIRIQSDEAGSINGFCYVPMFISIKSHETFSPSKASKDWPRMDKRLKDAGIERALCLLIVVGSKKGSKPFRGTYAFVKDSKLSEDLINGVVMKQIRIPHDDIFSLSDAYAAIHPTAQLDANLFDSHSYLKAHGKDSSHHLNANNALYSSATKALMSRHTKLKMALTSDSTGNPQEGTSSSAQQPKTDVNGNN